MYKYELSNRDLLLIELVHLVSSGKVVTDSKGRKWIEQGLTLSEVLSFLNTPIQSKDRMTALDCIEFEGRSFLNELKSYINNKEQA